VSEMIALLTPMRRPAPPELPGLIGASVWITPVAQASDEGAAGLFAQHVSVGQSPLAGGLLNYPGKALRNSAKKALAGIHKFARSKGLLLVWRGRRSRVRELNPRLRPTRSLLFR
jgi:hypothetical protein